jgi:hypothetical protein
MRFAIDVAFVAWPALGRPEGTIRVFAVRRHVVPCRVVRLPWRDRTAERREIAALELPAGEASRLGVTRCWYH